MSTKTPFAAALLFACSSIAGAQGYPRATIENHTVSPASFTVRYAACRADNISDVPAITLTADGPDKAKTNISSGTAGSSRGACLIRSVEGHFTKGDTKAKITTYTSSGTSYSQFMLMPTDDGYRIYSRQEYAKETGNISNKSPGFDIVNKTNWPVSVALSQVGCLYYGTIQPGQHFNRATGSVWFTINAHIQPDGKEARTDKDCIMPVAAVIGGIFITAASAGTLAKFGVATGAAGVAAATAGAKAVTKLAVITALKAGAKATVVMGAKEIGDALLANGTGQLKGQFAGYEWPFRCDQKPTYEITGGWGNYVKEKDANGDEQQAIQTGTPLKITKTNTCGNNIGKFAAP